MSVTVKILAHMTDDFRRQTRTLLSYEGQTPSEHIHEIGQPVWVWCAVELPDIHNIALILENGCFVIVHIKIVGGGEDGHDRGEACALRFAVHAVTAHMSVNRLFSQMQIKTYPASCASCARMMESRLLRSRN